MAFVDPATGETFEVTARFDVGSRPTVGDRYDVVYDRGAPRTAVVLDPGSDAAAWAVRAVAMLFIVGGLWRLLVKLGRLRAGLAEYRTAKELSGHTAEMPNEAAVVRRALLGGAPTTAPKTSPGGAPLGWYRDPVSGARPGDERWWDGARWTDHRRNLLADGA